MKIFLDMVGCRVNQAEIEDYARQFSAAGHEIVSTARNADLAVINTCSVTNAASSDSRQKIRQARRKGADEIIVTGCWSTLNPDPASRIAGVSKVVPNASKDELVEPFSSPDSVQFQLEPLERDYRIGNRLRTRAFIKVQDGCDNHCTFCITRLARGPGQSLDEEKIIQQVLQISDPGLGRFAAREIVLTGVHLGSWGTDQSPSQKLSDLVSRILHHTDVPRIRLSSLEPWDLDQSFFELWQNPRMCRHIHLPLQSGCRETLKRMNRNTTPEAYRILVNSVRNCIPDLAVTTDIITGFPGEDEIEFAESLSFVEEMNFAGGHVFTFSAQQGTAAGSMKSQVPFADRKQRNAAMRALLEESAREYRNVFIGKSTSVLWESVSSYGPDGWEMSGLTGNNLRLYTRHPENLWNSISTLNITTTENGLLRGVIVDPETLTVSDHPMVNCP